MLNHTIAAVILKLAYLATGLILCFIGKGLLEKGITGGFKGEGETASYKFRIVTSSPGLVFLVSGLMIVVVAVIYQAKFTETEEIASITREREGSESIKEPAGGKSLKELSKKTAVTSMLAEPSPQNQFALGQYDAAVRYAKDNNVPTAVTFLVRAVVLQPQLLERALESPDLSQAVQNPVFVAIVRERFKLPLDVAPVPVLDQAILGQLRIYIVMSSQDRGKMEDVSSLLSKIPRQSKQEPPEATLKNMESLIARNPRALLSLLEDPQFRWILEDKVIVTSLRGKIGALTQGDKNR
jgi:hypothetical protein